MAFFFSSVDFEIYLGLTSPNSHDSSCATGHIFALDGGDGKLSIAS